MNELSESLITTIEGAHLKALRAIAEGRASIQQAFEKSADCGLYLEEAKSLHRGQFLAWLRDNVRGITAAQAAVYLGMHRARRRRQFQGIDHRQLKLIGIVGGAEIEEAGGSRHAQRADSTRVFKWLSHAAVELNRRLTMRPIETWDEVEKEALKSELRPYAELYAKACGRM